MSALPSSTAFVTLEEYYVLEAASEQKHDYDSGKLIAMAGASLNHNRVAMNFGGEARSRLKGKPCEALLADFRIGFPRKAYTHHADVAIVCGGPEADSRDKTGQTFVNPTAVIEVLSPTTADFDRTIKFDRYRDLASFREYVIVFQDRPEVQTFFKQADSTWLFRTFTGTAGDVPLQSVDIALPLVEIYDRVTFDAPPSSEATDASPVAPPETA